MTPPGEPTSSKALELVQRVLDLGVDGIGGVGPINLKSSVDLGDAFLADPQYADCDARIDSLINWSTLKTFTSGFVTGLGGLVTLPAAIPASLFASWVLQAQMVGAIARVGGYDVHDERVRTMVLASVAGDVAVKEALKTAGVELSQKAAAAALRQVPGRVLIDINKKIGFRLLTKAGTTGVINFAKAIPFLGGAVGGTVDAAALRAVGAVARRNFPCP